VFCAKQSAQNRRFPGKAFSKRFSGNTSVFPKVFWENLKQNPAQAALLFLKDFPGFAHNPVRVFARRINCPILPEMGTMLS
jgi:hypothetical protein